MQYTADRCHTGRYITLDGMQVLHRRQSETRQLLCKDRLHRSTTTQEYHCTGVTLHRGTTAQGYHYTGVPLHRGTTAQGYHYTGVPLHRGTMTQGYQYIIF